MKRKRSMLLVVLLMAVGFAAVSTTLYINGQTKISSNQNDFNVYYSNALVNGVQDLSVVESEKELSFTTTFETIGEKYILDYDVTNGSKNYDAELVMTCSDGTNYLTVTNEFDDETILESLKTRSGKLTLELIQSYAGEDDIEVTITCTIDANAIERDSLSEGEASAPVKSPYAIGTEVTIANETFNIISSTKDTVKLLAQYNLGVDYKQSLNANFVEFSDNIGWEYTPGPQEIDINTWSTNPKMYINEYVLYLRQQSGDTALVGDLITLKELEMLGCIINEDYTYTKGLTCANSNYANWLVNGQYWWTRSAFPGYNYGVWRVLDNGSMDAYNYYNGMGIRPTITISKSTMNKLEIG